MPAEARTDPLIWLTAPLGILFCVYLAYGLPRHTWIRFWIWLAVGLCAYFIYSAKHSKIREDINPSPTK